jgi:hypothetical protein
LQKQVSENKNLWDKIEIGLERKRQNKTRLIFNVAASLAFLLSSALFIQFYFFKNQTVQLPLYSYSNNYGNAEKDFINAVNYQKQQIRSTKISVEHLDVFSSFLRELELLDATYDSYIEIIKENGCNDLMMELIIKNYQQKLDILITLQQELKKIKDYETNTKTEQTTLCI